MAKLQRKPSCYLVTSGVGKGTHHHQRHHTYTVLYISISYTNMLAMGSQLGESDDQNILVYSLMAY